MSLRNAPPSPGTAHCGNIAVTGIGIISALGTGTAAHLDALRAGRSGLRHPAILSTVHAPDYVVGEVGLTNDALACSLRLPTGDSGITRTTLLAASAIRSLLEETGTTLPADDSLAFINANTAGGMCSVEDYYTQFLSSEKEGVFTKYIDTLDCAESTEEVTRFFGWSPLATTLSTACSSSANSIILGARLLKAGAVKYALCGGCDALSRYTLNGFLSLKNVSRPAGKPFDADRNGLNLGEGAAYLLLEREEDAGARNADILGILAGWANGNDAHHPTAPPADGAGAGRVMRAALDAAGIGAGEVDYINAHGTGTLNNDSAEAHAIRTVFGEAPPPFSSTKPFTGHTLAAAGAVEAAVCLWSAQHGEIYPNLNWENRMEDAPLRPVTELRSASIRYTLSNSFGFGGTNVSLLFSRA